MPMAVHGEKNGMYESRTMNGAQQLLLVHPSLSSPLPVCGEVESNLHLHKLFEVLT